MIVKEARRVPIKPVETEGAEGVKVRLLIHEAEKAPHFYMRMFEVAPGGCTPKHSHPWEHEVYVLSGRGVVFDGKAELLIGPGHCLLIPGGDEHQYRNTGTEPLTFLCLVPRDAAR